jgi:hypothetical protein
VNPVVVGDNTNNGGNGHDNPLNLAIEPEPDACLILFQ